MATLLWFQRDLRINDNPALSHALELGQPLIAVYIHSPEQDAEWTEGAASRWWLHHSLRQLSTDLLKLGIHLQLFEADPCQIIPQLVQDYRIQNICWSNRHEPARLQLEQRLQTRLQSEGCQVQRFAQDLLSSPDQLLTAAKQTPYRVFTPFYNKLRRQLPLHALKPLTPLKAQLTQSDIPTHSAALSLDRLGLLDHHCWYQKLHQHWTPGEHSAQKHLRDFIDKTVNIYTTQRDYPAIRGSSSLSPHLHFGEISPQQILQTLAPLIDFGSSQQAAGAEAFLRQLIWREFARYTLWHFPHSSTQPMNPKFSNAFWQDDNSVLERWQQGKTGIPIVDAGMRELWQSGSMHNRVRMLVASLLTKNMGIPWQQGARWFWDTLVDADLANNTMGWQWVAGCGVDAAPYFRIFNPLTQAARFDPEQQYVRHWLGNSPPGEAIVDLKHSRQLALERYQRLTKTQ
ncbi:MAG: deoxyribodipyrimidine photo-lyase [Gammaproteobacteria bacterium]|nr:deoxyribodipyrimidine photo-lyase [Gammaproteobacteria bacterium]